MNIPKSFKINGIVYDIVELNPKDGKLTRIKNWGLVDFEECKIYINKNLSTSRKWKVLFHEAMHAFECDYEMDSAESYIQTISGSFYSFLKDNNLLKD